MAVMFVSYIISTFLYDLVSFTYYRNTTLFRTSIFNYLWSSETHTQPHIEVRRTPHRVRRPQCGVMKLRHVYFRRSTRMYYNIISTFCVTVSSTYIYIKVINNHVISSLLVCGAEFDWCTTQHTATTIFLIKYPTDFNIYSHNIKIHNIITESTSITLAMRCLYWRWFYTFYLMNRS